jgi:hypothetical protein
MSVFWWAGARQYIPAFPMPYQVVLGRQPGLTVPDCGLGKQMGRAETESPVLYAIRRQVPPRYSDAKKLSVAVAAK